MIQLHFPVYPVVEWVAKNTWWDLTVIRRPAGAKGGMVLPIRWTVERTFAWLSQCRRLAKDHEKSVLSSETFVRLAMVHLMLNRLEPKEGAAEFHDHTAV